MAASNRFHSASRYESRAHAISDGVKCIFISHQKKDSPAAKQIADYMINAGIDVYFDEYDTDLRIHHQNGNPAEVTKAICNGINNSSHMLAIISPDTMHSTWVPFEIGYGFEKTDLGVLCLKNIPKGSLPEYTRAAKIVRDLDGLNEFIACVLDEPETFLIEAKKISKYDSENNPLIGIMDSSLNDKY